MSLSSKFNGFKEIWQFDNRWHLIFTRLFFPDENLVFYKIKNVEFLTDHAGGDAKGAGELFTTDMYSDFFPQMKMPEKIKVLDLGANNGGFPLLLKATGIEIEKLVCVELNPRTFSRLQFNINRNFENECFVVNCAVTRTDRIIEFMTSEGGVGNNIYNIDESNNEILELKGITFDKIFSEYFEGQIVDLCKIDIENAEFEVFENDNHEQIKNCRYILMEIHHNKKQDRKIVVNRLNEIGFEEIDGANKSKNAHFVHLFRNKNIIND